MNLRFTAFLNLGEEFDLEIPGEWSSTEDEPESQPAQMAMM
jgi:hypothetical protein